VSSAAVSPGAGAPLAAVGTADAPARSRQSLLLGVCCLAQFMVILDVSIVNVALPSIHRSLGFSRTDLQWVINAYTITFAGFLMLSGRAADLLGGRRTFVTGLLVFSLASLFGGAAGTQEVLIGARALQGLGGAIMAASTLAIITSSFPPGPERHRAIGLWGAMNGAGGAAGTLLGGIITQELSWRWVLLINLPIGIAAALIARAVVVDRRREDAAGSFDLAGALTITGGLLALVYGIVNAGADGWGSVETLGPIGIGVILLVAFVVIEGRFASAPLVPLRVFSNRLLRVSNVVVVAFSAALFPMWYFGSLYLQEVLHFGPLDAGLAFLPMALTIMACATQAGLLVARFGAGPVLASGLTLMTAGLALFARISVGGNYVEDFLAPGLLTSVGIGLSIVPSTIAATATAAPSEAGLASGLVNTSRQMGGALGLAILASISVLYTEHLVNVDYRAPILALTDGFRLAFIIAAGFAAIGAVIAMRFIPRTVRPPTPPLAPVPAGGGAQAPSAVASGTQAPSAAASGSQAPHAVPAPRAAPLEARTLPTAPADTGAPGTVAPRASARTRPLVASVAFSTTGGVRWAIGAGSMTVQVGGGEAGAGRHSRAG